MKKSKRRTAKTISRNKQSLVREKNRIRGIISRAKSRAYSPNSANRAIEFQQLLADALAAAQIGGIEADHFLEWVQSQTQAQLPLLRATPVDSSLSANTLDRKPGSLHAELLWTAKLLLSHAPTLKDFRSHAADLEEATLATNWTAATARLETIESVHGKSIWALEARVAVTQARLGLDAQKQFLSSVRKRGANGLPAYLGRLFGIRNEPSTTLNTFLSDAEERILRIPNNASLKAYLRFKVVWNTHFSQRDLASVLAISQGLSIQDLYETFVDVSQHALVHNYSLSVRSALAQILPDLIEAIDDFRLKKLALLLGLDIELALPHRPYDASDAVISVGGKLALRRCIRELRKNPRAFRTALGAASLLGTKVRLDQQSPDLWTGIIKRVAVLFTFSDEYTTALSDLERQLRNWSFSPTLRACFFEIRAVLTDDEDTRSKCKKLAALNNCYLDIDEISLYLERFRTAFPDGLENAPLAVRVAMALNTNSPLPDKLSPYYATYYRATLASERSLVEPLEMLDSGCPRLSSRPLSVLVRRAYLVALFENNNVAAGIVRTIEAYFSLRIPIPLLPVSRDFATLRWKQLRPFAAMLELPIVLQIAWKATGSDLLASNLRSAYGAFLAVHNFSTPIDVAAQSRWSRDHVVYFLRFVAISEIIDMSAPITSSRAAREVRRDVCATLIHLDPDNKQLYEVETFSITRELTVQDGIRVLDSSRVHVDTGAITSQAVREWEPTFSRYRALIDAGIGISEELEDILRELAGKQGLSKRFLVLPDSDADLILVDLISGLRTRFLLDPNHGLDSYLSRRVRHHSMAGYLRGAVENQNLVTTKHHSSNRYVRNEYWPSRIHRIVEAEERALQSALARFCEEFDGIIGSLKSDILRIRSEEHPRGIFWITITPAMYHIIRSVAQTTLTVEALCTVCYPVFWAALQPALELARTALKVETYNSISSAFHRLKAALRKIFSDPQRYGELSVAIQAASEELNRKIVSIAEWFNKTESSQSLQQYSLEQALEICVQAAMYSCKPFAPQLTITVEPGNLISAVTLLELSDLVLTILGNVRQHAHTRRSPTVAITLNGFSQGGFSLRIESDIGPSSCDTAAKCRVEAIRSKILDGTYVDHIRSEGNSGLTKIASIALNHPTGRWDFGFVDDQSFFVEVDIPRSSPVEIGSSGNAKVL